MPDREEILKIYKGRCVMCQRKADHVHEIIPRSQTKNWDTFENRVPLCASCHDDVHKTGTKRNESILNTYRIMRLTAYYGPEYLNSLHQD